MRSVKPLKDIYTSVLEDLAATNRSLTGPKHAHLTARIEKAIRDGVLKPGDKLPTELQLVHMTPYSLGTVQRAIRSLVQAGLVERKRRLGTFVADRSQIRQPWHFHFLDDDGKQALPAFPRVVARSVTSQRGPWSVVFGGASSKLIRIDRVVNVNDEFSAYSRFFLDARKFAPLLRMPVKRLHGANLRVLIDAEFGVSIAHLAHKVSLRNSPEYIAAALGQKNGTPCLHVEIVAYSGDKACVYFQELTIPPTHRKLLLADVR